MTGIFRVPTAGAVIVGASVRDRTRSNGVGNFVITSTTARTEPRAASGLARRPRPRRRVVAPAACRDLPGERGSTRSKASAARARLLTWRSSSQRHSSAKDAIARRNSLDRFRPRR
jgi:hypothetical protein